MNEKRGAAHLEMIISFIFFVTFVLFLFLILKPFNYSTVPGSVLDGIYDSFESEVQTDLVRAFLRVEPPSDSNCFYVALPEEIIDSSSKGNVVRDIEGNYVDGEFFNEAGRPKLNIDGDNNFYEVLISPVFDNESLSGCTEITNYRWGGIVSRKILSYDFLRNLEPEYSSDYSILKTQFRVPEIYDFSIVSDELEFKMENEIPKQGEVYARSYIREVLYSNGTIVNVEFILRIW